MNFSKIFTKDGQLNEPISDTIRSIARDDLLRAIIRSNRDLIMRFGLDRTSLKTDKELDDLVINTEQSIYNYNGQNSRNYFETLLTYMVFLTDPNLSCDALLFRFLLNLDLTDLYLETDCEYMIFSDLVYSNGDPVLKHKCLANIIQQIQNKLPPLMYDYLNNQHCTNISPLNYRIPRNLNRDIQNYRDAQLDIIMDRLQTTGRTSYDDSDYSYSSGGNTTPEDESSRKFGDIFSDDDNSDSRNESDGSDGSESVKEVDDESDSISADEDHSVDEEEGDEEEGDEDEGDEEEGDEEEEVKEGEESVDDESEAKKKEEGNESDDSSDNLDIKELTDDESVISNKSVVSASNKKLVEIIKNIDKKNSSAVSSASSAVSSASSAVSSASSASSAVSRVISGTKSARSVGSGRSQKAQTITCDNCSEHQYTHSYRTPILVDGKLALKHFCSNLCMEQWEFPKKKK
jgi:hypothetical protein